MTTVVVVDDHPVFRRGLVALLAASGHEVVGQARGGLEAVPVGHRQVHEHDLRPDLRDDLEGF